jgi:soluble lytic murein transglycosylase-like protein
MMRSIRAEILPLLLITAGLAAWAQQPTSAAIDQQRNSLSAQRASLQRQMGKTNFVAFVGVTYGAIHPTRYFSFAACPPLEAGIREGLIVAEGRRHAVAPDLLRAVMHRESGFRPCAVSVRGALGLMQLMPATIEQFRVTDPFDPAQSVHAGAALLRMLLDRYQGDLRLTLAAYNAGSSRIENADPDSYPAETKSYIADILAELGVASPLPVKPAD